MNSIAHYQALFKNPMADEKDEIERLRRLGYRIRKPGVYERATFRVHADTLKAFRKRVDALNLRLQDAITEAIEDWLEKRSAPRD